jgi:RND superfamily putative drug exporter
MFDRLARLAIRWPRTILLFTVLLVGGAVFYGHDVVDRLHTGGATDPSSESSLAAAALDQKFADGRPNLVLLVRAARGVDSPEVAAEGRRLTSQLAKEESVRGVTSYWQTKSPAMRTPDKQMAMVIGRVEGEETQAEHRLAELAPRYRGVHGPVEVQIGGRTASLNEVTESIRGDISKAEVIGIPLTALVLILVFRSFVAAALPLLVGAVSVIGTNASLKLISEGTDVSIFAINLATGLSLGLAADYGLFIVRRYREERHRGADTEEAIRVTLNTAGRTVAFSSLTVAVAVSAMLVFPLYFLRSFAYAGVSVVLLAATTALVALPAGLVVLGKRVDALDVTKPFVALFRPGRPLAPPGSHSAGWRRMAFGVMRHPFVFAGSVIAVLLVLGSSFWHVNFGLPDDRLLPAHYESHLVQQAIRDDFTDRGKGEVDVLVPGIDPATQRAAVADYATRLSKVDGVARVDAMTGTYQEGRRVMPPSPMSARLATEDATFLMAATSVEDISTAGREVVARVRAVPAPFQTKVAGPAADLVDSKAALTERLPVAGGMIAATTLVLIFLLTGSVLIPIKALVMNTLSLSATFGVLVWVFQDYHLAGFFDFQQTGWVDVTLLVLLFCVAFGVSMDYEVFLLSRIKEEFVRTRDNRMAVAYGIEKTGGVVTAAALITSIVFIAMASSRVTNIKMFGFGLALAMLMDASMIRTVLVPAVMRLAGNANWWAPRPLRRVYDRFGLKEPDGVEPEAEPVPESRPAVPVRVAAPAAK